MNEVMFQGMKQPSPVSTPLRDVYTVSRLNREAKAVLEGGFPPLWIEGEISNLSRPASGHVYFSLKDAQAQVRCAFFRQHQRLLGLALKDSPPGFDPSTIVENYGDDDDEGFVEDEQL